MAASIIIDILSNASFALFSFTAVVFSVAIILGRLKDLMKSKISMNDEPLSFQSELCADGCCGGWFCMSDCCCWKVFALFLHAFGNAGLFVIFGAWFCCCLSIVRGCTLFFYESRPLLRICNALGGTAPVVRRVFIPAIGANYRGVFTLFTVPRRVLFATFHTFGY